MEVSQRCRPQRAQPTGGPSPELSPWTLACAHPPDAWHLSLVFVFPFCVCGGVSSSSVRRARLVYTVWLRTKMAIRDGIRLKRITYSYPYLSHLDPREHDSSTLRPYTDVALFVLVCCTTTHHSSYAKPIWKVVSHVLGKALLVERLGLFRFALSVRLGTL